MVGGDSNKQPVIWAFRRWFGFRAALRSVGAIAGVLSSVKELTASAYVFTGPGALEEFERERFEGAFEVGARSVVAGNAGVAGAGELDSRTFVWLRGLQGVPVRYESKCLCAVRRQIFILQSRNWLVDQLAVCCTARGSLNRVCQ